MYYMMHHTTYNTCKWYKDARYVSLLHWFWHLICVLSLYKHDFALSLSLSMTNHYFSFAKNLTGIHYCSPLCRSTSLLNMSYSYYVDNVFLNFLIDSRSIHVEVSFDLLPLSVLSSFTRLHACIQNNVLGLFKKTL